MVEYETKAKDKYKTGIDPNGTHTMEQLENVIAGSIQRHEDEGSKGCWGKINKAFRKLGEKKDDVNGWLGLFPSGSEYFSVLCGGFKLILEVLMPFYSS